MKWRLSVTYASLAFICLVSSGASATTTTAQGQGSLLTIQGDADRIARTLEASEAYSRAPEQTRSSARTLQATENAAYWAKWMVFVAGLETAVTLAGVVLVGLTLNETRRAAHEAKRSADEAVRAFQLANDEFVSTHRPRIHLRRAYQANLHLGQAQATLEFVNRGETDAHIVEVGVDLFPRYPFPAIASYHALPKPQSITLQPGKNAMTNVSGAASLTQTDLDAISSGQAELCLLTIVNYTDTKGLMRSISAFRAYRPDKRRFVHVPRDDEFAEWDYED